MPFVAILTGAEHDHVRVIATEQPVSITQPLKPDGTFGERQQVIVFQREVPEPGLVLDRLRESLAAFRTGDEQDLFACPVPQAVRALEVAVAQLWPLRRIHCPDCQHHFLPAIREARRMYLACPHCHNPLLNPFWDSA